MGVSKNRGITKMDGLSFESEPDKPTGWQALVADKPLVPKCLIQVAFKKKNQSQKIASTVAFFLTAQKLGFA